MHLDQLWSWFHDVLTTQAPLTPATQARVLAYARRYNDIELAALLARRPELAADVDVRIGEWDAAPVRAAWCTKPGRRPEELIAAARGESRVAVLEAIAAAPGLDHTTYERCARRTHVRVAASLFANTAAPTDVRVSAATVLARNMVWCERVQLAWVMDVLRAAPAELAATVLRNADNVGLLAATVALPHVGSVPSTARTNLVRACVRALHAVDWRQSFSWRPLPTDNVPARLNGQRVAHNVAQVFQALCLSIEEPNDDDEALLSELVVMAAQLRDAVTHVRGTDTAAARANLQVSMLHEQYVSRRERGVHPAAAVTAADSADSLTEAAAYWITNLPPVERIACEILKNAACCVELAFDVGAWCCAAITEFDEFQAWVPMLRDCVELLPDDIAAAVLLGARVFRWYASTAILVTPNAARVLAETVRLATMFDLDDEWMYYIAGEVCRHPATSPEALAHLPFRLLAEIGLTASAKESITGYAQARLVSDREWDCFEALAPHHLGSLEQLLDAAHRLARHRGAAVPPVPITAEQ